MLAIFAITVALNISLIFSTLCFVFKKENVEHLCSELKNPKYGTYYLCEYSQNLNSELFNFTCKINRVERVTIQEFSGH